MTKISNPVWVGDNNESEEGGYYESAALIAGKSIKVEAFKEKPQFDSGFGSEARELESEDGNRYWCIPIGKIPYWPDTDFDD